MFLSISPYISLHLFLLQCRVGKIWLKVVVSLGSLNFLWAASYRRYFQSMCWFSVVKHCVMVMGIAGQSGWFGWDSWAWTHCPPRLFCAHTAAAAYVSQRQSWRTNPMSRKFWGLSTELYFCLVYYWTFFPHFLFDKYVYLKETDEQMSDLMESNCKNDVVFVLQVVTAHLVGKIATFIWTRALFSNIFCNEVVLA